MVITIMYLEDYQGKGIASGTARDAAAQGQSKSVQQQYFKGTIFLGTSLSFV